jgi:tripartite-type tricarboxylate transporter receptor subunit TctC
MNRYPQGGGLRLQRMLARERDRVQHRAHDIARALHRCGRAMEKERSALWIATGGPMSTRFRMFAWLAFACAPLTWAQSYPGKPIRMIVGFAPGGTADIIARILAPKLGQSFQQPVIVDNRAGAGSAIGSELAAKAPPDGYTVLMVSSSHAINAALRKNLPYDSQKDFAGITLVAAAPLVLVVNNHLPVKSVSDLIKLARAKPGELDFASSGVGGTSHLAAELFKWLAKVELRHVPYKGAAPALSDVIAGQVQIVFPTLPTALPQIRAGRVRALGVTSSKRAASLPEVPTIAEAGVPGYDATNWFALPAPARTPKAVIETFNSTTLEALRNSEVRDAILRQGAELMPSTPAECERYLAREIAKWTTVIQKAGIRAE